MVTPSHPLTEVRDLARQKKWELWGPVPASIIQMSLDSDDLQDIICSELGECHCTKSRPTEKYFSDTLSDYYSVWVHECQCYIFLKLLVFRGRLVITSFKKDWNYG